MPMLRLMELTANVSGSQESMMRSMAALCGIEVDRGRKVGALGHARVEPACRTRDAVSSVSTM